MKKGVNNLNKEILDIYKNKTSVLYYFTEQNDYIFSQIKMLKYKNSPFALFRLKNITKELIKEVISNENLQDTIFVPMPTNPIVKLIRGHNHTKTLLKKAGFKPVYCILKKSIFSRRQTNLNKKQRQKNISKHMYINYNKIKIIKNKNIILFDDITTTKTSIKKAAWLLYKNGAKNVICVVLIKN